MRLRKTYKLKHLPPYLIFHVKRFTKNNFFTEKNPTIVNFPVKNLELRDYVEIEDENLGEEQLLKKSVGDLRQILTKRGVSTKDCVEKKDLVDKIRQIALPATK